MQLTETRMFMLSAMLIPMLALAQSASAEEAAPNKDAPPRSAAEKQENFDAHKAKVLERIGRHQARIEKHKSCVEAAKDKEAMQACKPQKPEDNDPEGGKR